MNKILKIMSALSMVIILTFSNVSGVFATTNNDAKIIEQIKCNQIRMQKIKEKQKVEQKKIEQKKQQKQRKEFNVDTIAISSGHSKYLPGACNGKYQEHDFAVNVVDSFQKYMNQKNRKCYKYHDNKNTDPNQNLYTLSAWHDSKTDTDLNVSVHLNSSAGKNNASGCEVLYYSNSEKDIAGTLAKNISELLGIPNRGAKQRQDLHMLRETKQKTILIEICFINNDKDIKKLDEKGMTDKVAKEMVETLISENID